MENTRLTISCILISYIINLVKVAGQHQLSVKEMMIKMNLKGRDKFLSLYLNSAIIEGYIRLLYLESPRYSRQKYLMTVKVLDFMK